MTTFLVQSPAAARAAAGLGMPQPVPLPDATQARMHLRALRRGGPLQELRAKQERGMAQLFAENPAWLAEHAVRAGAVTDVYVGVLPRLRREGGKDALPPTSDVVWCEADTEAAALRALDFAPAAPLVVQSSPGKVHCYWFLAQAIELRWLEVANRRLAWHLGGDLRATDAARILRVAGTRNHKRGEPKRVAMLRFDPTAPVDVGALVRDLQDPAPPRPMALPRQRPALPPDPDTEHLRQVPARQYIPALTGREVYHNFCRCPFHKGGQERTPSLSVGGPNGELWLCFGCDAGGDIFSFAAQLWGMDERADFPTLKVKLKESLR